MFIVFIRTIILYALIIFSMRIMGKRQLGELQPSEFVVTILISNIATLPIEDTNIPLLAGATPILVLVSIEVIISAITLKSIKARKIISGSPRIVISNGEINQQELKKLRFSVDDLMEALRSKDVFDLSEVDFAIVETTGKLSVYLKECAKPVTPSLLNIKSAESGPQIILISDGNIVPESLKIINKNKEWLDNIIQKEKYPLQDIFIFTANKAGDYYIIPKEKPLK